MAIAPRKLKTGAQVRGKLTLPDESASKAMTINSTGGVTSSVTTDAELAFLSGTTSNVQTQITANAGSASAAASAAAAAQAAADAAQADIDAHEAQTTGAHAATGRAGTPGAATARSPTFAGSRDRRLWRRCGGSTWGQPHSVPTRRSARASAPAPRRQAAL